MPKGRRISYVSKHPYVASGFSRTFSDMRVIGMLTVLAVARIAALAGHDLVWSWWAPAAYLWHDAGILLLFALIDRLFRRVPALAWTIYGALTLYIAISVPVMRVLSTPLTWTMWRAAGGALADSIQLYVTVPNVLWVAAIVMTALVPTFIYRRRLSFVSYVVNERLTIFAAIIVAALGPLAEARVDTHGLERNAWSVFIVNLLPRATGVAASAVDWRQPHARPAAAVDDLTRYRGAVAGRNVILVSLESTAAQYLGLYGAHPDVAPRLSSIAASALVFDHAYAVYPESIKGLLSMLCSIYPAFDRPVEVDAQRPCTAAASILKSAGYHTALFHSGRFSYLGMDAVVRNKGFDVLADAGDIGGNHESSFGVDDRSTVHRIVDWIDSLPRGERFFVTYLPIAGHHPYEVPDGEGVGGDTELTRYANAIRYGDAVLGELVDAIRDRGLESNTLWMLIGDHGEAFGQHDGNFGHTFQLYEENVHVPFVVAAPGAFPQQLRTARVVSAIDVAPTLLDLLAIPATPAHEGQSALTGHPQMALFFADYSLGLLGLRDGRFKYIHEIESGRSRLFDLERDPLEANDMAGSDPESVRWYRQRLRNWSATQRAEIK